VQGCTKRGAALHQAWCTGAPNVVQPCTKAVAAVHQPYKSYVLLSYALSFVLFFYTEIDPRFPPHCHARGQLFRSESLGSAR
jgi:hypothetical protein